MCPLPMPRRGRRGKRVATWPGGYAIQVVATPAGVWLSGSEGGNGQWMDFYSSAGLRASTSNHVWDSMAWLQLLAKGNVVWTSSAVTDSPITCFSASTGGSVRSAAAAPLSEIPLIGIGDPAAVNLSKRILYLASDTSGVVEVPIPSACMAMSETPRKRSPPTQGLGILARLPKQLGFASAPVLVSRESEVVALLEPTTGGPLHIAKIDLSNGRVDVGGVVAKKTAGLFTGASGQAFLLTLSGGVLGHFELWRVSDDLASTPLVRLPYPEKTAIINSWTDPTIAVAPVPSEDEAWIADANHVLLVDLGNGKLLASWPGASDNQGNITSLAMASSSGPLYATFCGPLTHNPPGCGQIVEIDPRTGSIEYVRHYEGIVSYGRFETVATPAGAWLSLGGGGNAIWLELFTKARLQPVGNGRTDHLAGSLGALDLMADGNVVWASSAGGLQCFSTSASGAVREAATGLSNGPFFGAGWSPFGIAQDSGDVLLVGGGDVAAFPIPKACEAASPTAPAIVHGSAGWTPQALRLFRRSVAPTQTSPRTTSQKRLPVGTMVAELKGSDTVVGDRFGGAVAISGKTAVVGASYCARMDGRAYVFAETTAGWKQVAELRSPGSVIGDIFGESVAISSTTIVVGAPGYSDDAGRAYVFTKSASGWKQTANLNGSDNVAPDDFGSSVAISGTTVVVGAPGHDLGTGSAYAFTKTTAGWKQTAELKGSGAVSGDFFGSSVAISDTTVVVGAPSGYPFAFAGRAYVFAKSGTGWKQIADLGGSDPAARDNFGSSVAISGSTAVVGAPAQGAYVFTKTASGWKQTAKLTASDKVAADGFGISVAIAGATTVVGAVGQAGRAYMFAETSSGWKQVGDVKVFPGIDTGDDFGTSAAISGTTAVVGAPLHAEQAGRAYLFES